MYIMHDHDIMTFWLFRLAVTEGALHQKKAEHAELLETELKNQADCASEAQRHSEVVAALQQVSTYVHVQFLYACPSIQ